MEQNVISVVSDLRTNGFSIVRDLMQEAEADALREHILGRIKKEMDRNSISRGHHRLLNIAVSNPASLAPLCNSFALAVWEAYLGPEFVCSTWTSNTIFPNGGAIYWHADYPYWTLPEPYPLWPLCGHTMWCLDDFTECNGATASIPGSHLRPRLPRLGNSWPSDAKILTAPRGSAIFADGAWWHTTTLNQTSDTRTVLLAKYIRPFCVPQEDMRYQLAQMANPSELVVRLFGGKAYQPLRHQAY